MNSYIVLVCGLNIRALNRITLNDQLALLNSVPDRMLVTAVEDKGSYLVRTDFGPAEVLGRILDALRSRCPAIKGAGLVEPSTVKSALNELSVKLEREHDGRFSASDFGLVFTDGKWRAGLAFPIYPQPLPDFALSGHRTKNAMFFALASGTALVAKRETKNVHWGSTVNDPVERLLKKYTGVAVQLTSRSANILRRLVEQNETRSV